jgi:pimeloyl-ACP methyl ester carboxylesterase
VWFGGVLEVVGGIAVVLGLFTRPVAFILSGEMAVAYFARMANRRLGSMMNDESRAKVLAEKTARSDQHVVAEAMFAMMTSDTRPQIPRIKTPVLVLLTTGNLPEGAAAEVETLYREQLGPVPDHELIVVNASRHYVMFDAPDVFFANLDRFLKLRHG